MFNAKHLSLEGSWDSPIKITPGKTGNSILDNGSLPSGYIYKFKGNNINSSSNQLKNWPEDPTIKMN